MLDLLVHHNINTYTIHRFIETFYKIIQDGANVLNLNVSFSGIKICRITISQLYLVGLMGISRS